MQNFTPPPPGHRPGLTFDWQDWLPYLEDQDIPEDQKQELIEMLWSIVVAFVDLGFELNPHQQTGQQNCGQFIDLKAVLEQAMLNSEMPKLDQSTPQNPRKEPTP